MKALKGTRTHENLKAAFAGESQANRRYLYFAAKADVEGQNDVSALFRSTAEGETGHAHGHLEYLEAVGDPATNLPIGRTRDNLKAAVAGETHEYTDMYPGMAKQARDEGFGEIADWFETLAKAEKELGRVFDICHGCRRCVNLCTAFPTLFDLVDASATMEVDGVAKQDYWKVVDQCYLCDMCYMTKCPYVPPHPWNVDFPHLMLRAKAIKFRKGIRLRDRLLSATDALGKLAAIPVVAQTVNAANKNAVARAALQSVLGVHKDRELPPYTSERFRSNSAESGSFPVKDGKHAPGKAAIFSTCYVTYNEPGMGHDLLALLEHNEVPYVLVEKESCCGMPKFELGDLDGVAKLKEANMPVL